MVLRALPEGGAGSEAPQTAWFAAQNPVLDSPQQHGDLGALRPVVDVGFVEDHELPMLPAGPVE